MNIGSTSGVEEWWSASNGSCSVADGKLLRKIDNARYLMTQLPYDAIRGMRTVTHHLLEGRTYGSRDNYRRDCL